MYEYQRSSALLDHSGAVAIKFEMGARRPCPGEAAHERLRNLRHGRARQQNGIGRRKRAKKMEGIGAGGDGGLAVRSSVGHERDWCTSGADLEQLESLERT